MGSNLFKNPGFKCPFGKVRFVCPVWELSQITFAVREYVICIQNILGILGVHILELLSQLFLQISQLVLIQGVQSICSYKKRSSEIFGLFKK